MIFELSIIRLAGPLDNEHSIGHYNAKEIPAKFQGEMMELQYTYWQGNDGWLVGYLNIWPDHMTQGKTITELEEMLADLYEFYKEEKIEKKVGTLKVSA